MLADLLIKEQTEGLSEAEQAQLSTLNGQRHRFSTEFERAIAAFHLAGLGTHRESPPVELRERLERQAQAFFAGKLAAGSIVTSKGAARPASILPPRTPRARRVIARRSASRRFGAVAGRQATGASGLDGPFAAAGWFAAAACLLLAIVGWLRTPAPATHAAGLQANTERSGSEIVVARPPTRAEAASPAEQRAALLAQASRVTVTLKATKDPAATGVTADVVWDGTAQRGFIRFVGLRPNDPRVSQYQAWIFDAGRDPHYPVDAGIFNVEANAEEVIVPIHAALPVASPTAFAVTVERPGGVVVSALEHVVAMGSAT
jgi:hypothetical protein